LRIYLVGGAVRDELLGRPVRDRDYVVIGGDEEGFLRCFPEARKVGRKKSVYYLDGDEYTISPAQSIEEDLFTRDLTINALARDEQGRVIAHPEALNHLEEKILYPVSRANFFADPARVFRAARFGACFPDFSVHPDLMALMREVADQGACRTLSAERVGHELHKSLFCPAPCRFVCLCRQAGALTDWFKELDRGASIPAGPFPYHDETVLEHLCQVMDRLAGDPVLVWMGLCHDLGKTVTPSSLWPAHHGHDKAGVRIARDLGTRLRLPAAMIRAGMAAARWHMVLAMYPTLRPGTRVDLLTGVESSELLGRLCALVVADGGEDVAELVFRDFGIIHDVHLPPSWQGLGPRSGERLRTLRAQALVDYSHARPSD
jgi:tRNA nucleotidyltransferase (CCA-adding enzyme)